MDDPLEDIQLQLSISKLSDSCISMKRICSWSLSGASLRLQGFYLNESGLHSTPNQERVIVNKAPLKFVHIPARSQYIILEQIGKGATSSVYKALHVPTLQLVAIKEISIGDSDCRHQLTKELSVLGNNMYVAIWDSSVWIEGLEYPKRKKKFRKVRKAFSKFRKRDVVPKRKEHDDVKAERILPRWPYLISLMDVFTGSCIEDCETPKVVSVVLELARGSLNDLIKSGYMFSENVIAYVARSCLLALGFLHTKGLMHRDVKPENILVYQNGQVKLSDFGISHDLSIKKPTTKNRARANTKSFVGTFRYMSPERINGSAYSYACDVWSVGLVCLHAAVGAYPIEDASGYWAMMGVSRGELVPQPPPSRFSTLFCNFVIESLKMNPDVRPSSTQLLSHPFVSSPNNILRSGCRSNEVGLDYFEQGLIGTEELEKILESNSMNFKIQTPKSDISRESFWQYLWPRVFEDHEPSSQIYLNLKNDAGKARLYRHRTHEPKNECENTIDIGFQSLDLQSTWDSIEFLNLVKQGEKELKEIEWYRDNSSLQILSTELGKWASKNCIKNKYHCERRKRMLAYQMQLKYDQVNKVVRKTNFKESKAPKPVQTN